MHPHACRRSACQWPAPGASRHRFRAHLAYAARSVVPHRAPRMRTHGSEVHAPQHFSGLLSHGEHRLHEKSPSAFVADVSHAADLASVRQIDVTASLAPSAPRARTGLVLWSVASVGCISARTRDIVFLEQSVQGHCLFPGLQLGGQGGRRILGHAFGRFHGSRCRDECH